ncbi:protein slit-like [Sitophilus oryzae]|uniref:Protein slit-like n=1 Tax=Sitophilus oryzae TaxID=7048 RepID=A0A6J2Y9N5_SITOR|nr:protein slit-like [Sitophilus oryzae]
MRTLFLLTLLAVGLKSECPEKCNCTETEIDCITHGLDTVPSFEYLDNTPTILDLSGNLFIELNIGDFDFPKSKDVKELYLNNSEIVYVNNGVFNPLENLQNLYLGNNYLSDLDESIISKLDDIILLEMSNNYFTERMPVIKSQSLEVLSLANSKISQIPKHALKYLPNLKLLLLQQNNLKTISFDIFQKAPANTLFVKLSYNPWTCSCDNMAVFKHLEERSFIDTSDPFRCSQGQFEIDIYGKGGQDYIEAFCQKENEIIDNLNASRAMIDENRYNQTDEENNLGESNVETNENISIIYTKSVDTTQEYNNLNFYLILSISTVSGFIVGAVFGILWYSFNLKYKRLELTDSKHQLIN